MSKWIQLSNTMINLDHVMEMHKDKNRQDKPIIRFLFSVPQGNEGDYYPHENWMSWDDEKLRDVAWEIIQEVVACHVIHLDNPSSWPKQMRHL